MFHESTSTAVMYYIYMISLLLHYQRIPVHKIVEILYLPPLQMLWPGDNVRYVIKLLYNSTLVKSSRLCHCVFSYVVTKLSEEPAATIFRIQLKDTICNLNMETTYCSKKVGNYHLDSTAS
jgi:hypothetical protein